MAATVLQMSSNGGEDSASLRAQLRAVLASSNIGLEDAALSTCKTYDLHDRRVLFFGGKSETPFCMIRPNLERRVFGNATPREVEFPFTAIRHMGRGIPSILHCGAFDGLRVLFCGEEFALVIDAASLLERLRSRR